MTKVFASTAFLIFFSFALNAQNTASNSKNANLKNGLAIEGYDPVSYFTKNKAEKGRKDISAVANGATYYFATPENKELFVKNSGAYQPQYGGWCAYAMGATGEKVEINPSTFKIINGKLYLFYNAFFNNTLKTWNKDEDNLKAHADKNWAVFNAK